MSGVAQLGYEKHIKFTVIKQLKINLSRESCRNCLIKMELDYRKVGVEAIKKTIIAQYIFSLFFIKQSQMLLNQY